MALECKRVVFEQTVKVRSVFLVPVDVDNSELEYELNNGDPVLCVGGLFMPRVDVDHCDFEFHNDVFGETDDETEISNDEEAAWDEVLPDIKAAWDKAPPSDLEPILGSENGQGEAAKKKQKAEAPAKKQHN